MIEDIHMMPREYDGIVHEKKSTCVCNPRQAVVPANPHGQDSYVYVHGEKVKS